MLKNLAIKILPKPLIEEIQYFNKRNQHLKNKALYISHVKRRTGLEIGGSSDIFKTVLPIYREINNLDGVNFSATTIWEGALQQGKTYNYFRWRNGTQFIADATDLSQIPSNSYEFLLSSNCLEHVANPIKALMEWTRVMRAGATIILVLPNKVSNFDHLRPYTSFEHLLNDFRDQTTEHDLSHLEEIISLHDLAMDPPAGTREDFRRRSLDNFNNRALHHHVFNVDVTIKMLEEVGFQIVDTTETTTNLYFLGTLQNK